MGQHVRRWSAAVAAALSLAGAGGVALIAAPAGATQSAPAPIGRVCRAVVFGGSSVVVCVEQGAGGTIGSASGSNARLYEALVQLTSPAGSTRSPVVASWSGQPPIVTPALRGPGPFCASLWAAPSPSGPSRLVLEAGQGCTLPLPAA
jgi:hypothetical protein